MNLKALITTLSLVLGTSSAALAKPVFSVSGQATVSVGAGPIVRDHRADGCGDEPIVAPRPVYYRPAAQRPVYQRPLYQQPVWHEPFFNPTNTRISASSSTYIGEFGRGVMMNHYRTSWVRPRGWFELTDATRIDSGREFFNLVQQGGIFSKLAVKNLGGETEITQVAIQYNIGNRIYVQKVRFETVLSGQRSLTIDLDHDSRTIQRIIVYGASSRGSAYQLLAL